MRFLRVLVRDRISPSQFPSKGQRSSFILRSQCLRVEVQGCSFEACWKEVWELELPDLHVCGDTWPELD